MGGSTAIKGPMIAYGTRPTLGAAGSENPELAPSLFWGGIGGIDPRVGYNSTRWGAIGLPIGDPAHINQVPSAISAVNIAASQTPTAGTKLTLVSSTGAGITVLSSAVTVWASGNLIPAGALAIDGLPGIVSFGLPQLSSGNTKVSYYDPTKAISRCIRITSVGNDSGATFLISGADLYGYPQTQLLTGANAGVATTTKAFKFIYSILPQGTLSGSAVSVGTADVFGFPMVSSFWGDQTIVWNNSTVSANTGYTAAVTTSPSTNLLGDVRGTYAVQSASDGTKRLMVYLNPSVANLALGTAGMFGVTPA
jgi:hypothetical protein